MISCRNRFCSALEKMVVLNDTSYYCRGCGYVVTKARAEELLAEEKFKPEPVAVAAAAAAPEVGKKPVSRGTKKKTSRSRRKAEK